MIVFYIKGGCYRTQRRRLVYMLRTDYEAYRGLSEVSHVIGFRIVRRYT